MKKRLALLLTALVVAVAFMPASAFAASKAKMTVYTEVYKTGNTVYCAGEGDSIYKVRVKDDKVTSKKKVMETTFCMGPYSYVWSMKKKGGYIYYELGGEGTYNQLKRVQISSGKKKTLTSCVNDYAIKGKKIYYSNYDEDSDKLKYRVMKLNGKNKKKSSVHAQSKYKRSNAAGYSVKYKKKGGYAKTYLKTPQGTYYLGKTEIE